MPLRGTETAGLADGPNVGFGLGGGGFLLLVTPLDVRKDPIGALGNFLQFGHAVGQNPLEFQPRAKKLPHQGLPIGLRQAL